MNISDSTTGARVATAPSRILNFAGAGVLREYWELTKPRLSFLSVITAVVGYLVANQPRDWGVLLALLLGTSLAAGAAGALNQWMEREADKRMARTRSRPLPSGAVSPSSALLFGIILAVLGLGILWFGTNPLATVLTLAILLSYLLAYTPMKQWTPWCTLVGAVPGALPPLVGWAAATGQLGALGWILFGILFAWQIPHFMAIAWMYRRDYAAGGMVMATLTDATGRSAARQSVAFAWALLALAVLPVAMGMASWFFYLPVAGVSSGWLVIKAHGFLRGLPADPPARHLFLATVLYLPIPLAALVLDRWLF